MLPLSLVMLSRCSVLGYLGFWFDRFFMGNLCFIVSAVLVCSIMSVFIVCCCIPFTDNLFLSILSYHDLQCFCLSSGLDTCLCSLLCRLLPERSCHINSSLRIFFLSFLFFILIFVHLYLLSLDQC